MRKVDGQSLFLIDFYIPALTPRLNSTETSLQHSVCCLSHVYRWHQQRDLDRHHVFGAYHLYIDCKMWGTGRYPVAPLLVYPLS
jgi:hypothetical protein